ncbi:MAG: hypothetical protein ACKOFH_09340, partial [Chthoniobacterales bacterium]
MAEALEQLGFLYRPPKTPLGGCRRFSRNPHFCRIRKQLIQAARRSRRIIQIHQQTGSTDCPRQICLRIGVTKQLR